LRTEGRVTLIDGILATAVLLGLALNAALGVLEDLPHRGGASSYPRPVSSPWMRR